MFAVATLFGAFSGCTWLLLAGHTRVQPRMLVYERCLSSMRIDRFIRMGGGIPNIEAVSAIFVGYLGAEK
jgi:hypothetical protein